MVAVDDRRLDLGVSQQEAAEEDTAGGLDKAAEEDTAGGLEDHPWEGELQEIGQARVEVGANQARVRKRNYGWINVCLCGQHSDIIGWLDAMAVCS